MSDHFIRHCCDILCSPIVLLECHIFNHMAYTQICQLYIFPVIIKYDICYGQQQYTNNSCGKWSILIFCYAVSACHMYNVPGYFLYMKFVTVNKNIATILVANGQF